MIKPSNSVPVTRVRAAAFDVASRVVPEEIPVAIVHDAATYAVMMATPQDLEDFAIGFSLTEGAIRALEDVSGYEAIETEVGVETRLWLKPGLAAGLAGRRRLMAGPTGCGLCGVESLELTLQRPQRGLFEISQLTIDQVHEAMDSLEPTQTLGHQTRAVHAAGFWRPDGGLIVSREDVGRHNAVDKVAGALARAEERACGVLLLTSRLSVELVQKASAIGCPVIAAMSAPTRLAIRTAEAAGITLIAVVRKDGFEIFTHPRRIAT